MFVSRKNAIAIAATAFAFGLTATSASASTNTIVDAGTHSSMAGKRIAAVATNGALTDYTSGEDAASCDSVTVSGLVSANSEELLIDNLSFTNCDAAGIEIFVQTDAATNPWVFAPTGTASPYGIDFTNWNTASAVVDCWDGNFDGLYEDTYRSSSSTLGGASIVNGSGTTFSKIVGVNAGPLLVDGGYSNCNLPVEAGIRGEMTVKSVDGVAVTAATNPIVVTDP